MTLTIREVSLLEEVGVRQIQRYVSEGFQGHKLKAVRVGKRLLIDEKDYRQWRVDCGFDQPAPEPKGPPQVEVLSPEPIPEPAPRLPAHCTPACPGGPLTNCPHPTSGNWPDPDALRRHYEEEARTEQERYRRGDSDAD